MLSKKEASALLRNVNFPGEDVTDLSSLGVSGERKRVIRERRSGCSVAAAIEIQRLWRGHRTRRLFKEILGPVLKDVGGIYSDPLPPIIEDVRLPPRKAAEIIQRAWRRFNNTKVYRFYRDLINFNGCGEPSLMLRCINPKEASLLDRAAGVRVRFRLGGENFPPNVYYKIFTYRNIVDLCASSPRDYTVMQHKRLLAGDVHNKVEQQKMEEKTDGGKNNWYQRWENNGWRLVPTRVHFIHIFMLLSGMKINNEQDASKIACEKTVAIMLSVLRRTPEAARAASGDKPPTAHAEAMELQLIASKRDIETPPPL